MSTYPEYSRLDRLYYYLGDCHFWLRQYDQAAPFFAKVVSDYSGQKLAKDASKKLAEIEKLKAAATAAAAKPKKS